jgi:hypothetical protein
MREPQENQNSQEPGSSMGEQPHSFRASIIDLVSARTRKAQQKKADAAKAKQAGKSSPANRTGANFGNKSAAKQPVASNTKLQVARGLQIIVLLVAVVYFMKSCDLF